jgi:CMP-N,N'-diacetyllegionaminic acid synthase
MVSKKKILALILARSGSKGLPGKNIRPLVDKPLIAWTLKQANNSKYINRIIVSTDDRQIAATTKEYNGEVPILRPPELATDNATSTEAIMHMVDYLLKTEYYQPDYVMLLQPTSPLRRTEDIDAAMELLLSKKAEAVVSVCKTVHHPWLSNSLPEDHNMKDFLRPQIKNKNRQELPLFYQLNGAIYLASLSYFKAMNGFIGNSTYALVMPRERSVDIDNLLDFQFAELLMKSEETIKPR